MLVMIISRANATFKLLGQGQGNCGFFMFLFFYFYFFNFVITLTPAFINGF